MGNFLLALFGATRGAKWLYGWFWAAVDGPWKLLGPLWAILGQLLAPLWAILGRGRDFFRSNKFNESFRSQTFLTP